MDCPLPTIIRDTREKPNHGFVFNKSSNCAGTVVEKLEVGDYAIREHLNFVVVERKANITELCSNLGRNRMRFEAELQKMVDFGIKRKYIVITDEWSSIFAKNRFTRMVPNAIFESIISLMTRFDVQFLFVGKSRAMGQKVTRSLLIKSYKHFMRETYE